jgi:hypothetical protein
MWRVGSSRRRGRVGVMRVCVVGRWEGLGVCSVFLCAVCSPGNAALV